MRIVRLTPRESLLYPGLVLVRMPVCRKAEAERDQNPDDPDQKNFIAGR